MLTQHICKTPCGNVQGRPAQAGITAFRGIRYATAGRWMYPQPVTHWDGVYDATQFGPNAMAMAAIHPEDPNSFYCREFRAALPYTYSEDCQYINLYVPDQAHHAPVIVYMHGGAFLGGSGWDSVLDSPAWPTQGVIAVTLNYRLGLFGQMLLPELEEEAGHAGNYNLYDQLAALQWVHDNIEAFGGDPENITLMGQSAGARSVQFLVGSPQAQGLVQRAVMSSGGGLPSHLFHERTRQERLAFWETWRAGRSLAELRACPAEQLLAWLGEMLHTQAPSVIDQLGPFYDGAAFPAPGTATALPGGCLDIPYLCGGNRDDLVPGLTEDARSWTAQRAKRSYAYCFARALPGDDTPLAWHSADLWYWFGSLHRCWRPLEAADFQLSQRMQQYLLHFATSGDPNGEGLPTWESCQSRHQLLLLDCDTARMIQDIPAPRVPLA